MQSRATVSQSPSEMFTQQKEMCTCPLISMASKFICTNLHFIFMLLYNVHINLVLT